MKPAESFATFADAIHGRVPDNHSVALTEREELLRRGICVDCTVSRVIPTRQGLCPVCGGKLFDANEVERMRAAAARWGLTTQPYDAVKSAAAKFMESIPTR